MTPLQSAALEDILSIGGSHSHAKSMRGASVAIIWLVRALHR